MAAYKLSCGVVVPEPRSAALNPPDARDRHNQPKPYPSGPIAPLAGRSNSWSEVILISSNAAILKLWSEAILSSKLILWSEAILPAARFMEQSHFMERGHFAGLMIRVILMRAGERPPLR